MHTITIRGQPASSSCWAHDIIPLLFLTPGPRKIPDANRHQVSVNDPCSCLPRVNATCNISQQTYPVLIHE